MKKLIINADDFGLNDHTVEWTIKGFERGALTSATIMAGMPTTEKAVAYAKDHPQFSFGVHFYLVDEKPMCRPDEIPSMIDPKTGKLWRTRKFIIRNFLGMIRVEDLKREMSSQFMAIKDAGVPISHVDGHGHNHRLPQSIKALAELKDELGFTKVRRCQDLSVVGGKLGLLSRIINGPMQRHLAAAGFVLTDHFLMNAGHTSDPKWFSKALESLPEGVTEIGVHPGIDEAWRRIDIEDCFNGLKKKCMDANIELTSFDKI
ncbi:MAG: ChbG/HpnK family deacetylase [Bacteroidales bacterium]|nr:ChbG/HpnK family deacetylase [Bacteroidales bacterium]